MMFNSQYQKMIWNFLITFGLFYEQKTFLIILGLLWTGKKREYKQKWEMILREYDYLSWIGLYVAIVMYKYSSSRNTKRHAKMVER